MDLKALINKLVSEGEIAAVTTNPFTQFGTDRSPRLGLQLMPEKLVRKNAFRELAIKYKSIIANNGPRYSPPVKKGGALVGSFLVELGSSDIAMELTAEDLDAVLAYLGEGADENAAMEVLNFVNSAVEGFLDNEERQIWQAIVSAQVIREGDDYREVVDYANPAGHRSNATAAWSTDTTDIFEQINDKVEVLRGKGFEVSRIITGSTVIGIMAGNDTVKQRVGVATISADGQITASAGRASLEAINGELAKDGLPVIETYNRRYNTSTGTGFHLARNAMVFLGTTGRDVEITGDDNQLVLTDTLGYMAVGLAPAQSVPGRNIVVNAVTNTAVPRVELEGKEEMLPVLTEPDAVAVISAIS